MGRRNLVSAPLAAFDPSSVPGLVQWLDADDPATFTLVGSQVSQWRDKSGTARHVSQATEAARPTLTTNYGGRSAVTFGASQFLFGTPGIIATRMSVFVVFDETTRVTGGALWLAYPASGNDYQALNHGALFIHEGGVPFRFSASSNLSVPNTLLNDANAFGKRLATMVANGNNVADLYIDSHATNTDTSYTNSTVPSAGISIGARYLGGHSNGFRGHVLEVLVYNRNVDAVERRAIERYLATKWNLSVAAYGAAVSSPLDVPNCALWLDAADASTLYTTADGAVTAVSAPTEISGCVGWWDGADQNTLYTTADGAVTAVNAPTDIAGCAGWWDASDASSITQSGGLISQWNDKSGNGRHATASGTTRPTYTGTRNGRNVITFDGTGNRMNTTLVDSATQTILFVAKAAATGAPGTRRVVSYQAERGFFASSGWNWFSPNAGTGVSPTDYNVASGVITNNTSMLVYGNGFAVSAAFDPFNAGATTFVLGSENASTVFNLFQGEIAEVVVFNTALSDADRARVERYLSLKWGIQNVHSPATETGQPVGYWADKSGLGNHATASSTARPAVTANGLNGRCVLTFNGANTAMRVAANAAFNSNDLTYFVVFRQTSTVNKGVYTKLNADGTSLGFGLSVRSPTAVWLLQKNAALSQILTANVDPTTATRIYTVTSTTTATGFLDGATTAAATGQTASHSLNQRVTIGARDTSEYLNGYIAEIIHFNVALSTTDRARVERYLSLKWGISDVHAQVTGTGQPVGYWADKSGNNRHALALTATARPALTTRTHSGKPALSFNGTTNVLSASGLAAVMNGDDRPATLFCVVKPDVPATNSCILGWANTGNAVPQLNFRFDGSTWVIAKRDNGSVLKITAASSVPVGRVPQIAVAVLAGTTATIFRNAVAVRVSGDIDVGTTTVNDFVVGALNSTLTAPFSGVFAEVIVFNTALSDAERTRIEQYLNNKWGVGFIPPAASHPDALTWINQVYINGGAVSQRTADAVSSFCREIDAAGLRSKFYRLNLFCGNNLLACRTPLYRGPNANERYGFDLDVLTIGSGGTGGNIFTDSDYIEYGPDGGLRGRLQSSASAHAGPGLRTGLVPGLIPALYGPIRPIGATYNYNTFHLAAYCRNLRRQTLGIGYFMGGFLGVGVTNEARHCMSFTVDAANGWSVGPPGATVGAAVYDNVNRGLYLADVRSTAALSNNEYINELTLYAGAFRYGTSTPGVGPFVHPSVDIGVFGECRTAATYSSSDGSLFRSEQTLQGYSIGLGFTEEEVAVYSRIMNRFQNRLGRGLPETTLPAFATISNLDARDWLTRVYNAGGTVSTSTAEAVQTFCNAITAAGIRDRFFRLNLLCGNNIEACVVPLYRGPTRTGTQYGNLTDRNFRFGSEDYIERGVTGGLTGDGTTKYLQTGLSPADISPAFPGFHAAAYKMTTAISGALLGSRFSHSTDGAQTQIYELGAGGNTAGGGTGVVAWSGTNNALLGVMRQSSTNAFSFRNDQKSAATTSSVTPAGTPLPFTVFCRNFVVASAAPSTYSPNLFTDQRLGAYSIGGGMTDEQLAAYATAMQAFQTALNRQV
jgi:hypothetical protein